jgi:hypothetical protein
MRLVPVLGTIAWFSLACTLLNPENTGDEAAGRDTGQGGDDEGSAHQTSSCRDYLTCLEEVDKKEYDKKKDDYGENGSCWDNESSMRECDDACEQGLTDQQDEHPGEPACLAGSGDADDTGDTDDTAGGDTGEDTSVPPGDCAIVEGDWSFQVDLEYDTCLESGDTLDVGGTVSECTESGRFMFEFPALLPGFPLTCTSDGADWSCFLDSGSFIAEVAGSASGGGVRSTVYIDIHADWCDIGGSGEGETR